MFNRFGSPRVLPALLPALILFAAAPRPAAAGDVIISTPTTFASLDGSVQDDDHTVNGVFTTDNLALVGLGTITADDPQNPASASAGNMRFAITQTLSLDAGTSITAENRYGGGSGGNITINAGISVALAPTDGAQPGGRISTRKRSGPPGTGASGCITIETTNLTTGAGSAITAGENVTTDLGPGGAILLEANFIDIGGEVASRSGMTAQCGSQPPGGGTITINGTGVGSQIAIDAVAVVSSRGLDPGADLVHLQALSVNIGGLVESTGLGTVIPNCPPNHVGPPCRPDKPCNSVAGIEVWADTLIVARAAGQGEINADVGGNTCQCVVGRGWIDLYARSAEAVFGETDKFVVHSNASGPNGPQAGIINAKTVVGTTPLPGTGLLASNLAFQADDVGPGGCGGKITVESNNDVDLTGASLYARGYDNPVCYGYGGCIYVRSYNGSLHWDGGVGDVRPTGTLVPASHRGVITLVYAVLISDASTFPSDGLPTTPTVSQQSGGSPTVPSYVVLPSS